MTDKRFVSTLVEGGDGAVRALFINRAGGPLPRADLFPGITSVAVLPRRFDDETAAAAWLETATRESPNAATVEVGRGVWVVGAWVSGVGVSGSE